MKLLITGGAGFIGTHLSKRLIDHEVHVLDRLRLMGENYHRGDINDYQSLERVFEEVKPELVIHLAGMVSRKECEETPTLAIQTNAGGTYNVCALSLKHRARLIYSGSSEEYGTALLGGAVVDEETVFGEPTSVYSMTKRMAEEIVQYHAFFKGLKATTMRIFMLYGPGEEPSDYRSALVRFTYWALKHQPLTVHVNTERSWCYIADAVEAMKLLVERDQKEKYEVFNIGRADPVPTEQLAEMIVKLCGSRSEIRRVVAEPTVIPVKRASFKKAKEVLGWEADCPLEDGLKEVVEWVRGLT
jgi:nucleoside-diphosphate-sugar epimerase